MKGKGVNRKEKVNGKEEESVLKGGKEIYLKMKRK